jgi:hypothetical protein
VPSLCHILSWKRVPWALGLLFLIASPALLSAQDPAPSDTPLPSVPMVFPTQRQPLSATERAAIMADKELEAKTKSLPSLYRVRNAPTTRVDPSGEAQDPLRKREINRLNRTINGNMRSIDNSIRDMRTTIYRMRSMQRRRF